MIKNPVPNRGGNRIVFGKIEAEWQYTDFSTMEKRCFLNWNDKKGSISFEASEEERSIYIEA